MPDLVRSPADLEAPVPVEWREAPGAPNQGRRAARLRVDLQIAIPVLVLLGFVVVAVFAGQIAPYPYAEVVGTASLQSPSSAHLFGTDDVGRDIFSRVVYGTRVSLGIATPSVVISLLIALPIALAAAHVGGWLDAVLMRVMDAIFAFPAILLGIALVAVLGPSTRNLVIVIVVLFVPRFVVVIRAAAQSIQRREYVEAARAMGARALWINRRHVLPNIGAVILVELALSMSTAILVEAALSFLGLGAQPPMPSWGGMLGAAQNSMTIAPWTVIYPGLAIVIAVLALNLLADGLRDRFDVKRV